VTSGMSLKSLKTDQSMGVISDELVVIGHSMKPGIVCVGETGIDEVVCGDCSMDDRGSPGLGKSAAKMDT
jgi:hypothetical protein